MKKWFDISVLNRWCCAKNSIQNQLFLGFAKIGYNKKSAICPLIGICIQKAAWGRRHKEKNNLTFEFYIDDFVLKIPFKCSFCLGFAKIGKIKKSASSP